MRGWFDPEVNWGAAPTGKRGPQPTYSDAAVQTCLTMKVLFGMALRQTTSFVESLLRLAGWTGTCQISAPSAEDTCGQHSVSRFKGPAASPDPLSSLPAATAGQWTAPASRSKGKANGT